MPQALRKTGQKKCKVNERGDHGISFTIEPNTNKCTRQLTEMAHTPEFYERRVLGGKMMASLGNKFTEERQRMSIITTRILALFPFESI